MNQTQETNEAANPLEVGMLLGQRRAFTTVVGRCSAANAQLLRRIRDEKLYRSVSPSWRAFCPDYLHLSRRHADHLIALLNRFGSIFFELSDLVGITPRQYLAVEPAVREDQLVVDGEAISLIPKNAARIGEAVSKLLYRSSSAEPSEPAADSVRRRITELGDRGRQIANQLVELYRARRTREEGELILEIATDIRLILLQPDSEQFIARASLEASQPGRANPEARRRARGPSFPPGQR